jgi:hypothetical protein
MTFNGLHPQGPWQGWQLGRTCLGLFLIAWSGKWLSDYGRMPPPAAWSPAIEICRLEADATSFNALFGAFHTCSLKALLGVYYSDT